jgi:large subunit ribosomal protein L6
MSRIGKMPIKIPDGVKVNINNDTIEVIGPKGALVENINKATSVNIENDLIYVERKDNSRRVKAFHGLMRALINNMIEGVTKGFVKKLEIVGVGYRANMKGKNLELIVGLSHPVLIVPEKDVEFKLETPQKIAIYGVDKQKVGAAAAYIKAIRKPDPYKGKGIRYEGEHISLKSGKAVK